MTLAETKNSLLNICDEELKGENLSAEDKKKLASVRARIIIDLK